MIMLLYSSYLCFRHYNLSLSQTQKKTHSWKIQVLNPFTFYLKLTNSDIVMVRGESTEDQISRFALHSWHEGVYGNVKLFGL